MAKSAGERAIRKEEKRLEKERKRRIEQANKMLIPVSKKTNLSLGLISFDPEGCFRLKNNRWMKVFEVKEDTLCQMAKLSPKIQGRMRITMHLGDGYGRETCHISLMENGEIYEEVRQKFKSDEEILRENLLLKALSIDEVMSQIAKNFFMDIRFSYASYVRGNKDWKKECFAECRGLRDSFTTRRCYGESLITLFYPSECRAYLIEKLKELGCEIYLGMDLKSLAIQEQSDFNRAIEKRYNRRISVSRKEYINASMLMVILCDSDDARKIVQQTIMSLAGSLGFMIAPAFAAQESIYHSVAGLGLVDAKIMRNVNVDVITGLLGGDENADAEVKIRTDENL